MLRANSAEPNYPFFINCMGVIKKGANDSLDPTYAIKCQRWAYSIFVGKLYRGAIDDLVATMG